MKRFLLAILFCVSITASALAQDRTPPTRRTFRPSPHLSTAPNTDNAFGIVQTPYGYLVILQGDPIPAQSNVGIFGYFLQGSSRVLLWGESDIMLLEAATVKEPFFNLERIIFRLPENVHGEVWVTVVGRQTSNTVRIIVE